MTHHLWVILKINLLQQTLIENKQEFQYSVHSIHIFVERSWLYGLRRHPCCMIGMCMRIPDKGVGGEWILLHRCAFTPAPIVALRCMAIQI